MIIKYYDVIADTGGGSEERTFEEISSSLSTGIDKIIEQGLYWKKRCLAAEEVMNSFPSTVLEDQAGETYLKYLEIKKQ